MAFSFGITRACVVQAQTRSVGVWSVALGWPEGAGRRCPVHLLLLVFSRGSGSGLSYILKSVSVITPSHHIPQLTQVVDSPQTDRARK